MSVRHAVLALLSEGPMFGLQLQQEFQARTGEAWLLNVGQVYSTLQRLERDGFVAADGEGVGRQKRFKVTPAGREELQAWLEAPSETASPPRDELVMKVLVALSMPDVDVHRLLQTHRRHLVEAMQHYTHIKAEAAEDEVELALVADAQIFRLEAAVRWLDAADTRLGRAGPRNGGGRAASASSSAAAADDAAASAADVEVGS